MTKPTLKEALASFVAERNWQQYHNAKNFACAVCAEAGELMDEFIWVKDAESDALRHSPEKLEAIKKEAADVYINLLQLSRHLDFDLEQAAWQKLEKLKTRYPAEACRTAEVHTKKHAHTTE